MDDDVTVEEDEALRQFLPQGFGKQTEEANVAAQIARTKRGPVSAAVSAGAHKGAIKSANDNAKHGDSDSRDQDDSDDDDDDDDSDDDEDEDEYPISHELVLKTHESAVTSVSLDASGSRMVSGSTDGTVKLYDFASMTPTTLRAFKSVDPSYSKTATSAESHPINTVAFNPHAPAQMLVVTATSQAKILSRDGEVLTNFVKGDMYLRDMHNTKGHVSEITAGAWHPTKRDLCVTAGTDSTLRIWDANVKRSQKEVLVFKSKAAGNAGRTRMTAVAWGAPTHGGSAILVAAALDGSLVMWSGDGPHVRPTGEIKAAHQPDTWTSGIAVSPDGRTVVTRGGDDTIKLWDTRKFKDAVTTVPHASTSSQYPTTNIIYAPNGTAILTGSASGHLHILNPATLRPDVVTPVTPSSPLVTVEWHPKINQILTGSANAETHVLYSPTLSTRGAATVMSKAPKRRHIDDDPSLTVDFSEGVSGDNVTTAGQSQPGRERIRNPTIGLTASGKSRDPRRPHLPQTTPFSKTNPDEAHIRDNIPLSSMRDEDPREALLKYAGKAAQDPLFTNAWKKTQPTTMYADLSDGEGEDGDGEPEKKRPRQA